MRMRCHMKNKSNQMNTKYILHIIDLIVCVTECDQGWPHSVTPINLERTTLWRIYIYKWLCVIMDSNKISSKDIRLSSNHKT